jgi:hypothetical protein
MTTLTLEEYKEKLVETNKKVYELLADDSQENTVYVLHERGRNAGETNLFIGIFKNFESLYAIITDKTDFLHTCEWADFCIKDYYWYAVQKYLLVDSEYQLVLDCDFDIDGNLLKYSIDDEKLGIDFPLVRNVEKLFENGDIIKVNSLPFGEPYYGIYLYDKKETSPHIMMIYENNDYDCYWISEPERLEKVENCPVKKINKLNKTIKKDNRDYKKAFKKKKITMDFVPF